LIVVVVVVVVIAVVVVVVVLIAVVVVVLIAVIVVIVVVVIVVAVIAISLYFFYFHVCPISEDQRRIRVSKIGVITCTPLRFIRDLFASLIISEILPCGLGQQMICLLHPRACVGLS
jgi:hypothetical protein